MKTLALNKLKEQYEFLCNEYVKKFCNKQGLDFEDMFWVADCVGEVCAIGDYFFNFTDICLDINTKQPKGLIFSWYEETLEYHMKHENSKEKTTMNYLPYTKGLRYDL